MSRTLLFAALVALVACTTPAERCISNATEGLAEIDAEIAEAEANIARGYRLADGAIDTVALDVCSGSGGVRICVGGTKEVPQRHIPINVTTESARLAALKNQRASMIARSERELAACQNAL